MKKLLIILASVLALLVVANGALLIYNNYADDGIKEKGITSIAGGGSDKGESQGNIALEAGAEATSYVSGYSASFCCDGYISSYWEGTGAYPQELKIDLGQEKVFSEAVVKLNPIEAWGKRTMSFECKVAGDNGIFYTVVEEKEYVFDYDEGNSVAISFDSQNARYFSLVFTSNSGAGGGQVAELELYSK